MHGHLHRAGLISLKTPVSSTMVIAADACYESYEYPNNYNLVRLDLTSRRGTIFLRAWSRLQGGFWTEDTHTYAGVKDGIYEFPLDDLYPPLDADRLDESIAVVRGADSTQAIESQFRRRTDLVLNQIHPFIPGITDSLPREEVAWIEDRLQHGKPVALTGDVGTGKSGIGAKLAQSAREQDKIVLLLDARHIGYVQDENTLRGCLGLREHVYSAMVQIGRERGCRLIVDQLDNVAGSASGALLADLAIECSQLEGLEVVTICRKQERLEVRLVEKLIKAGFAEKTSIALSKDRAASILIQLGVLNPPVDLISVGRNLLNLELIGTIKQEHPDSDFSGLMDEVDLWVKYITVLLEREETTASGPRDAEQILAEAVALARAGLNSEDRTFRADYPLCHAQRRLVSWKMITCEDGQIYRFRHERLQDFLYAWDATQRHAMPPVVLSEISLHRTKNILVWMDGIYLRQSPGLHRRFLEEVFYVQ